MTERGQNTGNPARRVRSLEPAITYGDLLSELSLSGIEWGDGPSVVIEWPLCYNVLAYRGISESWVFMAETTGPGADGNHAPAAW